MPDEVISEIREKYHFVEECPMTHRKRLFFDNSGGTFRLKACGEGFANADNLPDCAGHSGEVGDYLASMRKKA